MISNHRASSVLSLIIVFISLLGLAACEENLDTLAPVEGIFWINGYLDAAADTQWVRVTPFRTTILTTPDPVDAVVTLEHLGTGQIVELNPSVFVFPNPNFGGDAYGHNFWTDAPIERGATYRLVARRSDGESATAMVRIPHGLTGSTVWVGTEYASSFSGGWFYPIVHLRVDIPDGDHFAFLNFEHKRVFPHPCSPHPVDNFLYPAVGERPVGPHTYEARLQRNSGSSSVGSSCGSQAYIGWTAQFVLSGEHWPSSPGDYVGYLDKGSNIDNGMGYVGGVVSERIPVPRCALQGPGAPSVCDFFFGPETVTLDVMVRDPQGVLITNIPDPFNIEITKAGESWSRTADLSNSYAVNLGYIPDVPLTISRFPGLLEGEFRIHLPAIEPTTARPVRTYCEERTVVLTAGEHRTVEIETVAFPSDPPIPLNANGCREG